MMRTTIASWAVASFCLLCFAGPRASGAEPASLPPDPMIWKQPAGPPNFRPVLSDAAYKTEFERAKTELGDIHALEQSKRPAAGARIVSVSPGSQAAQIGLQVGEYVVAIDGRPVWSAENWPRDHLGSQELTVVSAGGERRKDRVHPGRIGVQCEFEWFPQQLYLHGGQRDPRWDVEALIGVLKRADDPDLAESAWCRAIRAGYRPDYFSASCGAEIAMAQGRADAALDFASAAMKADARRGELVQPDLLYRIGLANYKLEMALSVARQNPGATEANPAVLQRLINLHRARPEAERRRPPPSALAAKMYHRDLIERMVVAANLTRQPPDPQFRARKPFEFSAPSGSFWSLSYSWLEPVQDIEVKARFTIRPHDNTSSQFAKILEIAITDLTPDRSEFLEAPERAECLLYAGIQAAPPLAIIQRNSGVGATGFLDHRVQADGAHEIELRLIRVGGQGEIFLNGGRIAYLPTPTDTENIGFLLKIVGATAAMRSVQVDELIEMP